MDRTIIHVDMDAFFAAVEVRDDPSLKGKPLIIGALPSERGVVSTCSYEARAFGVRSAMSIKEAYRRCPDGIYMHPNGHKYVEASRQIHEIWATYTDIAEYISLDEGYLDVSASAHLFGGALAIAKDIKARTLSQVGLSCSVGIGYSMSSAKLASEEKKPDGLFEIPNKDVYTALIIDRPTRVIPGVGSKTAEKLGQLGIHTVRDILANEATVLRLFGAWGQSIVAHAKGIDERQVTPYYAGEAKSYGREHTFQQDISDIPYLKNVLILIARELGLKLQKEGLYAKTITLKVTYGNMRQITRAKSGTPTNLAGDISKAACELLDGIAKQPIRLVGISLSNLSDTVTQQLSMDDMLSPQKGSRKQDLQKKILDIQMRYGDSIIQTGTELSAKKQLTDEEKEIP